MMETNKKMTYVPPTVEITKVALEVVIAGSPVNVVQLEDWKEDTPGPENNSDIWLNF
ncbi:MAG: hypothetical protein LBE79_13555 [Tannerella sp.]|jgi:hypothetical protein|nr:hypothetical protein [Tannerella sp.]